MSLSTALKIKRKELLEIFKVVRLSDISDFIVNALFLVVTVMIYAFGYLLRLEEVNAYTGIYHFSLMLIHLACLLHYLSYFFRTYVISFEDWEFPKKFNELFLFFNIFFIVAVIDFYPSKYWGLPEDNGIYLYNLYSNLFFLVLNIGFFIHLGSYWLRAFVKLYKYLADSQVKKF